MTPETILSEKEEKDFEEFLHNKIKDYNNDKSPHHREGRKPGSSIPLNIILRDKSGNFIGGLSASTYWEWLDIDDFYVPEEFRGKGIGTSLLQTAETIAVKRGCTRCFLSTIKYINGNPARITPTERWVTSSKNVSRGGRMSL